jgi:hypothetical protein
MTQPNLLELAKQGNARAIATLMNRQLQAKNITAQATLKEGCLQVMLESQQVPDQETSVTFVRYGLTNLKPASIQKVKVYGRKTGENTPAWSEEFYLTNKPNISTLKEQAKQRHIDAITTLLNRALEHKNILTKATLEADCLQIIVESASVPDQQTSTTLIRRELLSLKVDSLKTVKLYGRQRGDDFIAWSNEFDLVEKTPSTSRIDSPSQTNPKQQVQAATFSLDLTPVFKKIEESLRIFRSNIIFFILIYLTVLLPTYVLEILPPFYLYKRFFMFIPTFIIPIFIFSPIATGATIYSTHQIQQGRKPNYPEAMSVGFRKWGLILVCRFLVVGFIFLCSILLSIGLGILLIIGSGNPSPPSSLFFAVPYIFGASWILAIVILLLTRGVKYAMIDSVVIFEEKRNPIEIIQRSDFLMIGRNLQVVAIFILFGLAWFVLFRLISNINSFDFVINFIFSIFKLLVPIVNLILDIFLALFYWEVRQQKSAS